MPIARIVACLVSLAMIVGFGCGSTTPATLHQKDGSRVPVTIAFKTGDNIVLPSAKELPSGTPVTILGDGPTAASVRIRIDEGEFQGQDGTVARDMLRTGP